MSLIDSVLTATTPNQDTCLSFFSRDSQTGLGEQGQPSSTRSKRNRSRIFRLDPSRDLEADAIIGKGVAAISS